MNIRFHKQFKKQFDKLPPKLREKVMERLELFRQDSNHPILRNHPLGGKFRGYFSIDITGDVRALFRATGRLDVLFTHVGTHSQLY